MTVNIDYETEKELGIDYASLANRIRDIRKKTETRKTSTTFRKKGEKR